MPLSQLPIRYIQEGEKQRIEVVGVRIGNEEAEPLCFIDGPALFLLCRFDGEEQLSMLKQFGAADLLFAGLHPAHLSPSLELTIERLGGGGYWVDSDRVDSLDEAME